jgi:hypothetical protein
MLKFIDLMRILKAKASKGRVLEVPVLHVGLLVLMRLIICLVGLILCLVGFIIRLVGLAVGPVGLNYE